MRTITTEREDAVLMAPASEKFAALLSETSFESPRDRIGVIHNVDVAMHPSPEVIRAVLAQQISQPVRWSETIRFLSDQGVRRVVECGPGKVLAGLNKRIVSSEATLAIVDQDSLNTALESIQ